MTLVLWRRGDVVFPEIIKGVLGVEITPNDHPHAPPGEYICRYWWESSRICTAAYLQRGDSVEVKP